MKHSKRHRHPVGIIPKQISDMHIGEMFAIVGCIGCKGLLQDLLICLVSLLLSYQLHMFTLEFPCGNVQSSPLCLDLVHCPVCFPSHVFMEPVQNKLVEHVCFLMARQGIRCNHLIGSSQSKFLIVSPWDWHGERASEIISERVSECEERDRDVEMWRWERRMVLYK